MSHPSTTTTGLHTTEPLAYDTENKTAPSTSSNDAEEQKQDLETSSHAKEFPRWIPSPLRPKIWIPTLLFMLLLGAGLEIALYFNKKSKGWPTGSKSSTEAGFLHYVYTVPPVVLSMFLVKRWKEIDGQILKMQPFVDLAHGDSPPHRSVLLDYTRDNEYLVWMHAWKNKHYIAVASSFLAMVAFLLGSWAGSLFNVQDTLISRPNTSVNNLAAIGLNQDAQFQDLTSFVTAAGFASASVLYKLGDPPFLWDDYTIAPFQIPTGMEGNGSVTAETTAVRSSAGCENAVSMNKTLLPSGGYTNFATASNGCSSPWDVDNNSTRLFEVFPSDCPNNGGTPNEFRPVVFWFFAYNPVLSAAIFCSPSIELVDVRVTIDLASANITSVTRIGPFTSSSKFASASANVTGSPLNGRAYNGVAFNATTADRFTLARQNATQLILPAAVLQVAETSPDGLTSVYNQNRFADLSTMVYMTYLKLIAKTVYFIPSQTPMTVQLETIEKRVWLSDVAVHIIAGALFVISIGGSIVQILYRKSSLKLRLPQEPGTIAATVSLGAKTHMASLLNGYQNEQDVREMFKDRKFGIDPKSNQIIMESEKGYENALLESE